MGHAQYQPPFTLNGSILSLVVEVGENLGWLSAQAERANALRPTSPPPQVAELLRHMAGEVNREVLQGALGLADRKSFRERYLRPALDAGLIAMSRPDKPNSRLQCYYLTALGE